MVQHSFVKCEPICKILSPEIPKKGFLCAVIKTSFSPEIVLLCYLVRDTILLSSQMNCRNKIFTVNPLNISSSPALHFIATLPT